MENHKDHIILTKTQSKIEVELFDNLQRKTTGKVGNFSMLELHPKSKLPNRKGAHISFAFGSN